MSCGHALDWFIDAEVAFMKRDDLLRKLRELARESG
jgi:hypothetical protein